MKHRPRKLPIIVQSPVTLEQVSKNNGKLWYDLDFYWYAMFPFRPPK